MVLRIILLHHKHTKKKQFLIKHMRCVQWSMYCSLYLVIFTFDSNRQACVKINQYPGSFSFVLLTVASLPSVSL